MQNEYKITYPIHRHLCLNLMKDPFTRSWVIYPLTAFLFLLVSKCIVYGQESYLFKNLSVREGLSQSTVNALLQDKEGFIWIGTSDGLNRYDGNRFIHFKNNPRNTNSLSSPVVLCMLEDEDGILWLGTDGGGLVRFDKYSNDFKIYLNDSAKTGSITNNKVWGLCKVNQDILAVCTFGGGILLFNVKTGIFKPIKEKDLSLKHADQYTSKVVCYNRKLLCYGTRNGFKTYDLENGTTTVYRHDSLRINSLPDNKIQSVYLDKQNRIWIGTFEGYVCEFRPEYKDFISFKPEISKSAKADYKAINCFLDADDGYLWFGTLGQGMYRYDRSRKTSEWVVTDTSIFPRMKDQNILCIMQDRSGILWAGTTSEGLIYYHPEFGNFRKFHQPVNLKLSNRNIYSIYRDRNRSLWVGTNGGGVTNFDQHLRLNFQYNAESKNPEHRLDNNNIWAINGDMKGRIWIASMGGGIIILDQLGRKVKHITQQTGDTSGLQTNNTWSLTMDQEHVWISTQTGGVNRLELINNKIINYKKNPDGTGLNARTVYTTKYDSKGNIMFGTKEGGLNILDIKTGKISYFIHNEKDTCSISNNDVYCLLVVNDSLIWCGTNGGGLNLFLRKKSRFISITENEGLPNNVVYSMQADKKGDIWISTNKGLTHIILPPGFYKSAYEGVILPPVLRNYTVLDGIPSNEFNQGASFQDEDGFVYFGSIDGLTIFDPGKLLVNRYHAPVSITSFRVFEKSLPLDTGIAYKKQITLPYDQNYISFEFAVLNYLLPEKNTYSVKMEGLNPDWIYTGSRSYASYTNLEPGQYVFRVRGYNNDGILSQQEAAFYITITPPFWKTFWFKTTILLFVILVFFLIYLLRERQIRKEEQKKSAFNIAIAQIEMKALRAQMNPHFIFNCLNSINNYINKQDSKTATDYLARFSRLIRLVFENSMSSMVSLYSDLEALELYIQLEQLRFGNKLEYVISIEPGLETEKVLVPPLLIQPFVENAILHGLMHADHAGKISIGISTTKNDLIIIVKDNGIGRAKAAGIKPVSGRSHKSLGLKVTNERIELLKQSGKGDTKITYFDLLSEEGIALGTRVEIVLPLEVD